MRYINLHLLTYLLTSRVPRMSGHVVDVINANKIWSNLFPGFRSYTEQAEGVKITISFTGKR